MTTTTQEGTVTYDQDYNIYQATKQLQADLTELDAGRNSPEVLEYFTGQLHEAARRWLSNIDDVRRYGAELQRDVTRTLDLIDQGYGIDLSRRLGQRVDDYNVAVSASRELAESVTRRADAVYNALGRLDAVELLLDGYTSGVFASVKAA